MAAENRGGLYIEWRLERVAEGLEQVGLVEELVLLCDFVLVDVGKIINHDDAVALVGGLGEFGQSDLVDFPPDFGLLRVNLVGRHAVNLTFLPRVQLEFEQLIDFGLRVDVGRARLIVFSQLPLRIF